MKKTFSLLSVSLFTFLSTSTLNAEVFIGDQFTCVARYTEQVSWPEQPQESDHKKSQLNFSVTEDENGNPKIILENPLSANLPKFLNITPKTAGTQTNDFRLYDGNMTLMTNFPEAFYYDSTVSLEVPADNKRNRFFTAKITFDDNDGYVEVDQNAFCSLK